VNKAWKNWCLRRWTWAGN